ncbi:MAG: hypothetical protein UHN02_03665 [Acutalibacteraceae bacterium]|nr:hypothetical protein [Acutalibacteraceae bacterium]
MKKVVSLILCLVLTFSLGVSVFAANYNEQLKSDILAAMPDDYEDVYYPQAEKVIDQLDITEAQYTELKAILDATVAAVDVSKGPSMHDYTEAERNTLLSQFDAACSVLGLTYEYVVKTAGDVVAIVYGPTGKKLGEIDGDITPSKTDSAMPAYAWALIALAVAVSVGGAVVFARKKNLAE